MPEGRLQKLVDVYLRGREHEEVVRVFIQRSGQVVWGVRIERVRVRRGGKMPALVGGYSRLLWDEGLVCGDLQ